MLRPDRSTRIDRSERCLDGGGVAMATGPAAAARRIGGGTAFAIAVLVAIAPVVARGASAAPSLHETGRTSQGWALTPGGVQTDVGAGPQAVAVSPNGDLVVVANAGYVEHSLMTIDPSTGAVGETIPARGG